MLDRLVHTGVDVFRINMSHSSHDMARDLHAAVRFCEHKNRHPLGILYDLQGPKFRLGNFKGGRIASYRVYFDMMGFMGQLGLLPPPK